MPAPEAGAEIDKVVAWFVAACLDTENPRLLISAEKSYPLIEWMGLSSERYSPTACTTTSCCIGAVKCYVLLWNIGQHVGELVIARVDVLVADMLVGAWRAEPNMCFATAAFRRFCCGLGDELDIRQRVVDNVFLPVGTSIEQDPAGENGGNGTEYCAKIDRFHFEIKEKLEAWDEGKTEQVELKY